MFSLGHRDDSTTLHLTRWSFVTDALCGESVDLDGEPELAIMCDDCDRLGREAGGDHDTWVAVASVLIELRAAA